MTIQSIWEVLQIIGPAVAVYIGIRSDMSAFHVRLDHLERDLYKGTGRRYTDDRTNP